MSEKTPGTDTCGLTEKDHRILNHLTQLSGPAHAETIRDLADETPLHAADASLASFVLSRVNEKEGVKITKPLCRVIRTAYGESDDLTMRAIAEELTVAETTVRYHIRDSCSHDYDPLSTRQCNAIRAAAHDGLPYTEMVAVFSFVESRHQAAKHAHGRCSCPAGVDAVEPDHRFTSQT